MLEGNSQYDEDLMRIAKELGAKGIVLIVIEGKNNKRDIEFASMVTTDMIPKICGMLHAVADELTQDFITLLKRKSQQHKNN